MAGSGGPPPTQPRAPRAGGSATLPCASRPSTRPPSSRSRPHRGEDVVNPRKPAPIGSGPTRRPGPAPRTRPTRRPLGRRVCRPSHRAGAEVRVRLVHRPPNAPLRCVTNAPLVSSPNAPRTASTWSSWVPVGNARCSRAPPSSRTGRRHASHPANSSVRSRERRSSPRLRPHARRGQPQDESTNGSSTRPTTERLCERSEWIRHQFERPHGERESIGSVIVRGAGKIAELVHHHPRPLRVPEPLPRPPEVHPEATERFPGEFGINVKGPRWEWPFAFAEHTGTYPTRWSDCPS